MNDTTDTGVATVYRALLERAPENKIAPDLSRIERLVELLGHPERAYRVIHVAGTNGKTSTTRMIERLLRELGLRTGRFTSPHLDSPTERIAIDGHPIDDAGFVAAYRDVEPFLPVVDAESIAHGGPPMTFFEVLTAMAFAAFADAPVDIAVIEVGLGGSWDATNVVSPDVTVITPISLDHQQWLGNDILDIAGEKAGILKPGATAILANQTDDSVMDLLVERAAATGERVARAEREFGVSGRIPGVGGQVLSIQGLAARYEEVFVALHGEHQAQNAAVALAAVEALIGNGEQALDADAVGAAFAGVTSPGRLEVVRQSPTIVVDAAHNPAGAEVLVTAVREVLRLTRTIGLFGALADKDAETMLVALEPLFDEVVITESSSARAVPTQELAELARDVFSDSDRVHEAQNLDDAIQFAVDLAERAGDGFGGVVATGSVTIAAEVRTLLGRGGDE